MKKPENIFILEFEWSESPYHQGAYEVLLSYHPNSGRWILSAPDNPSGEERLSRKKGNGEEDLKEIAVKLLRKSYDKGAITFDLISNEGPFDISIEDFVPPKTRWVETREPIDPPQKICKYCRHLSRDSIRYLGGVYKCKLGNWSGQEWAQVNMHRGEERLGEKQVNFEFTCDEFEPAFKTQEETYY
mgnify:CR=1 FL=1|tara:strand:+ start:391 stop:951 length:561 start_codon:yes stop_codon:yes gene_type:complete